jgi:signal transduction histidine kinase
VQDLADSMNLKLAGRMVRVRPDVEPGMPLLPLDGEQIRQMLANLAQNGIDAVEAGAAAGDLGAAAVGRGGVSIEARLSPARDIVLLRVSDTGCGMPPETIKDIFTPFYTTKQLGQGTGMGLSIVYGVVKMHAGDIAVDSAVGKGTSFLVRIPIGETAGEESHERGENSAAGG